MVIELLYLIPLVVLVIIMVKSASGIKAKAKAKKPPERTPERIAKEEELLQRLERLKRRQDKVADAIDRDPVRAAKVVRTIMKQKGDSEHDSR